MISSTSGLIAGRVGTSGGLPSKVGFRHTSPFGTVEGKTTYLAMVGESGDDFLGFEFEIHDDLYDDDRACVRHTGRKGGYGLEATEWFLPGQRPDRGNSLLLRPIMTGILQTTIAGSLPKPGWLSTPDQLWAAWRLEGESLEEAKRDAVRLAVEDQVAAGLDIICDGEQPRQHFVTTFIEGLEGVDSVNRATVTIRRRYEASVPRVVGPVSRAGGVYVDDAAYFRSLTDHPVKYQLPGPMTMTDTLADEYYGDRAELAMVFAGILNAEARDLVAAGVDVIQFDEPAFNVFLDEVGDWGVEALEAAAEGLDAMTAVHICYGYGVKANIDWKAGLGDEWRQYEVTFPVLARSSIDQVSIELANSHVPIELLDLLEEKSVQAGVIDVATDRVESPDDVAATIERVLEHVPPERLYPTTNCGMVPLSRSTARAKLRALGEGSALARGRI